MKDEGLAYFIISKHFKEYKKNYVSAILICCVTYVVIILKVPVEIGLTDKNQPGKRLIKKKNASLLAYSM